MKKIARIVKTEGAELLDAVIGEMQDGLASCLPWLDHVFGRVERLVKNTAEMRRIYTPAIYTGGGEYIEAVPSDTLGNYCFFTVGDPQETDMERGGSIRVKAKCSIVLWFDYRRLTADGMRTQGVVVRDVLDALNGRFALRNGRFFAHKVWTLSENVFDGFSLDEVDNQFLMAPYGGMRVEGSLTAVGSCLE